MQCYLCKSIACGFFLKKGQKLFLGSAKLYTSQHCRCLTLFTGFSLRFFFSHTRSNGEWSDSAEKEGTFRKRAPVFDAFPASHLFSPPEVFCNSDNRHRSTRSTTVFYRLLLSRPPFNMDSQAHFPFRRELFALAPRYIRFVFSIRRRRCAHTFVLLPSLSTLVRFFLPGILPPVYHVSNFVRDGIIIIKTTRTTTELWSQL